MSSERGGSCPRFRSLLSLTLGYGCPKGGHSRAGGKNVAPPVRGTGKSPLLALLVLMLLGVVPAFGEDQAQRLRERSVEVLRQALEAETGSVRIRAAEALLWNNNGEGVKEVFSAEAPEPGSIHEIGVWQILAQATLRKSQHDLERQQYVDRILQAFLSSEGERGSRAAESLAKMGHAERPEELLRLAIEGDGVRQVDALWLMAASGTGEDQTGLASRLESVDPAVRARAAYAIRRLENVDPEVRAALQRSLSRETADSSVRIYLLSALYVHGGVQVSPPVRSELLAYVTNGTRDQKLEAIEALAQAGGKDQIPLLEPLMFRQGADAEIRVAAANALMRIDRRDFRGLGWVDWFVVAAYGAFMLGVGWYYSRRQTDTEEYFLGSRSLGSFVIGISLYATLLSTISYLAVPGELVKHGPGIVVWGMLGIPLIVVFCGFFLLPVFMKLRITSAYELLEGRLGIGVRITAAVIFILTRLVWMALLIYLAAKAVVVMVGWSESATPMVVMVAGAIAVLYTALGGLRAVVITDVIQFVILFAGGLVTMAMVTMDIGLGGWVPTSWAPHWDEIPVFDWNPAVRVTVIGSILSGAVWSIFTYGSDQVAIQRYLATRDTQAARRALYINIAAGIAVSVLLAGLGFSVLGFFQTHPHAIADGKDLLADADFLFPHFIANFLPQGLAGLVIAAMFAAAMSSLDSGINSIVTVFHVDFLGRFRRRKLGKEHSVKLARALVLGIGIAVVLLSAPVGNVPGNITEVTNKTNGLFVAPLFGLFFMCLFVPFATPFGAIVGAAYGFSFAFLWAFWDQLTGGPSLSFQWIYLFPFIVHVVVGSAASLLPTRGRSWRFLLVCSLAAGAPIVVAFLLLSA